MLGWLAKRLPQLVREIASRCHEVASHGNSKRLLEDITGAEVGGFRAPNFSVDDRVLALIRECGYRYDSSYNAFALQWLGFGFSYPEKTQGKQS